MITTSRERLREPDERLIAVGPLPSRGSERPPAIALFYHRATAASGEPLIAESDAVREITERLDGNALAIELCASRAGFLGLSGLKEELERGLEIMTARTAPGSARFRSLSAAIDWSYQRLPEDERHALALVSQLLGSFTVAQAAALFPEADLGTVAERLQALWERSLLGRSRTDPPRYRISEPVRQYLEERLPAEEQREAEARIEAYYLGETIDDVWLIDGRRTRNERRRLEEDAPNLRAIYERARRRRDPASALKALLRLSPVYLGRGPYAELCAMVNAELSALPDERADLRPLGLVILGEANVKRGRFRQAFAIFEEVEALGRQHGSFRLEAFALIYKAGLLPPLYRETEVTGCVEQAQAVLANHHAPGLSAFLLETVATILILYETAAAERRLEEARLLFRSIGDRRGEAYTLGYLGVCRLADGANPSAEEAFRAAKTMAEQIADLRWAAFCDSALGFVYLDRGELDAASDSFEQSLPVLEASENHWLLGIARLGQGHVALERERYSDARRYLLDALGRLRPLAEWTTTALTLGGLGMVAARTGDLDEAQHYLESAQRVAAGVRVPLLHASVSLHALELPLARAFSGDHEGGAETLRRIEAEVREALEENSNFALRVPARALLQRIERARGPTPRRTLTVGPECRWLQVADGPDVDLRRRWRIQRVLRRLLEAHQASPGAWLDVAAIFAAGWPGESARPASVTNRVYVTVSRLRKLGLGDLLESDSRGFRIRPDAEVMESKERPPATKPA